VADVPLLAPAMADARSGGCVVCGETATHPYCLGVVRCRGCGLVFAERVPDALETQSLYQREYFFGGEYFDYAAERAALERNFRDRLEGLPGLVHPAARVVELGCAYGYFLNLIKDRVAWHLGFDPSADGVAFARRSLEVNATTADFVTFPLEPASVDLVFMWDVIEHLSRPDDVLRKVSEVLAPGGHVALTTGDVSSWLARMRGGRWRMIHPPTHVYYFSPSTLERLLDRYGLEVRRVRRPAIHRNLGSALSQLARVRRTRGGSERALRLAGSLARRIALDRWNVPCNLGDIVEVLAVRRP
jgi:SAM-dependent methyltransferase